MKLYPFVAYLVFIATPALAQTPATTSPSDIITAQGKVITELTQAWTSARAALEATQRKLAEAQAEAASKGAPEPPPPPPGRGMPPAGEAVPPPATNEGAPVVFRGRPATNEGASK